MSHSAGHVIDQACKVLSRTYKELVRLKDDCASLLLEHDSPLNYSEEYSYGGRYLHLRASHAFLFRRPGDAEESPLDADSLRGEEVFALICIFQDEDGLNRISLNDEPELWAARFTTHRKEGKWRPWDAANLLKIEHRNGFVGGTVACDGQAYEFTSAASDESGQLIKQYDGNFVGCPLAEIRDREAIQTRLLDPLFPQASGD